MMGAVAVSAVVDFLVTVSKLDAVMRSVESVVIVISPFVMETEAPASTWRRASCSKIIEPSVTWKLPFTLALA